MIEQAEAIARAAGETRAAALAARLAAQVRDAVPRARVLIERTDLVIEGRRLRLDPALRWLGSLIR